MKTNLTARKQKITDWVNGLEDKNLIDRITQLMNDAEKERQEKIAHWFRTGITGEELKKRVNTHIDSLSWKK